MQIKSLSLYLPDESIRERLLITGRKSLLLALDEILNDVNVDLEADDGQGVVLPLLIAEAKVSNSRIYLSYHVFNQDSGLLTISYQNSKGKTRTKDIGVITRCELENHLRQILTLGKNAYIEEYFPPQVALDKLSRGMGITVMLGALLGYFSLFYFSNVIWRDQVIANAWQVAVAVYIVSGLILLPQFLSKEGQERAASVGQTRVKQACGLVFGNVIITLGLMCGGMNALHLYGSQQAQVHIVFADKARDYYGKHCKGSVSFEQFSGSVCLKNRAYWQVIHSGMLAQAEGKLSDVGFDIQSITLTGQ
ncbi:hypothetical protein [Photobacterium nomapromontoriensis]|uniref:hypothetical protein n=1 Tax=Photobacterium nomapromontoriensis TaxID=2910237 RepID=UPI003D1456A4